MYDISDQHKVDYENELYGKSAYIAHNANLAVAGCHGLREGRTILVKSTFSRKYVKKVIRHSLFFSGGIMSTWMRCSHCRILC